MLSVVMQKVTHNPFMLSAIMLNVTYKPFMLNVTYKPFILNVTYKPFMLSVIVLNVVMLSAMAPLIRVLSCWVLCTLLGE
jgi:hypothetical protein